MKLINEGNSEWRPWWIGRRMKCVECGREVELESHDLMSPNWYLTLDDSVQISCERCGNTVVLKKDAG